MDSDDEGIVRFVPVADGYSVDAPAAFLQGDVFLFGYDEGCIVATELEMLDDGAGDDTVVLVRPEASVRRAFARGLDPVAIIYQNLHFL